MQNIFAGIGKNKKQKLKRKKLHIPSGNYAYVCTRVKAKRSFLLPKDTYSRLLVMDIPGITRFIGEGQYKKEINELSLKYSGSELVETALNKNMSALYHQILEFSKGDLQTMLSAYLQRWNIWNIKTVLRGKVHNATSEEIMKTIVPAGGYTETYWKEIIDNSNSMDESIESLKKNDWYPTLVKLKEDYGTDLSQFESKLEIEYYTHLLNLIPKKPKANLLFIKFIKSEIDLVNLKTLFMTKSGSVEPNIIKEMLIPGGEFSLDELQILVDAADFKQFVNKLQKFSFYEIIKDDVKILEETGELHHVIRALEQDHAAKAKKFSYTYPLSILPIMDYFIRKKIEVDNLRIIAKGKDFGLNEDAVKEMLVI